jgi:transposase
MKPLTISDPVSVLGLQEEIRRSHDSRYDHRLHGVLLVAQGMSCPEVARLLGDSTRTVEYWVQRFEHDGLGGLVEAERSGRPRRLDEAALEQINLALRDSPQAVGLSAGLWDGKSLSAFIKRRFKIKLGVRQCQRLFRDLDFRLRKPRPLIAQADPRVQRAAKKNSSP